MEPEEVTGTDEKVGELWTQPNKEIYLFQGQKKEEPEIREIRQLSGRNVTGIETVCSLEDGR